MTTDAPRIIGVAHTPPVLIVSTSLTLTPTVLSGIKCTSNRLFGRVDYVVLEYGVLVCPLEQLVNRRGGMQRQGIKKLVVRVNSLLHRLQDRVWAHGIELEDRGPKMLHKSLMDSDLPIWTWKRLVMLCLLLIEHIY